MPLQNRVTPDGDIIRSPERGLMMGNRGGPLHGTDRALGNRRWVSRQWIACRLEFNGRHREVMTPGRYTELFFLDEATALAAGHRPCFECRRQEFLWFARLWAEAHGENAARSRAPDIDAVLHGERVDDGGEKVTYLGDATALPSGSFVRHEGRPHLVLAGWLLEWTPAGYTTTRERPSEGLIEVLTPRSTVAVLSAGYCPSLHPSADVVS